MVVLPSPYAYAWFEAPAKQFNLEVKVGCKDPNSVDYCEDCQVEDNSRCGPCNAGWTKTNEPNMKCWAVGSMSVDCATSEVIYHPMGCVDIGVDSGKDCTCGGKDAKEGCGQQISHKNRRWQREGENVTSKYPHVSYRPSKENPGYYKSWQSSNSYSRSLWGVTADGKPVFDISNTAQRKKAQESGGLLQNTVYDRIKANCGGTTTRYELTEADRKSVPPLLGANSAVDGPAITTTDTTPESGLDNTSIADDSSVVSPVTSYTIPVDDGDDGVTDDDGDDGDAGNDEDTGKSSSNLMWPIAVIGLLGVLTLRGGKR